MHIDIKIVKSVYASLHSKLLQDTSLHLSKLCNGKLYL